MAQRKSLTAKRYEGRDVVLVELSTGYRLIIERPTLGEIEALNRKAEELFPAPPRPTERVVLATGEDQEVPLGDEHQKVVAWRDQLNEIDNQRGMYFLQYALEQTTTVEGYEDEEGQDKLIRQFEARMDRILKFGTLPPDVSNLSMYARVIRLFLIADAADLTAVMQAVTSATTANVDEETIRAKIRFFHG